MGLRVPFVLSLIGPFNCCIIALILYLLIFIDSVFMLYLYLYSCSLVIYAPNKSCYNNNHAFWKTSGYSLKCVLELVASTSHGKVLSKAPGHWTGLSRTSSKTYWAANRTKPLVARSTNGIVIQIYLRHITSARCKFNRKDSKLFLLPK